MDRPSFSVQRDRLKPRIAELARLLLSDPSPQTVRLVGTELDRMARG